MIKLIISDGKIVAEALESYDGTEPWIEAPADYVLGSYILPFGLIPPTKITRSSGLLALRRHHLLNGELLEIPSDESMDQGSLYASVKSYRDNMSPGLDRDKVDIALNDTGYWLRDSPTVGMMAAVIPLTPEQLNHLFSWAQSQEDQF